MKAADKLGVESFVLSSLPLSNSEQRLQELAALTPNISLYNGSSLTWESIRSEIERLQSCGVNIIACLSVWEGYRDLMSLANELLGREDISIDNVRLLRDKYLLRKQLIQNGLSNVFADILDHTNFENYKNSHKKYFVKPRVGIASYGAFSLGENDTWEKIESIKNEILADKEYRSIFTSELDFILEEYIEGKEYSFEIIALEGIPYIIGIHEKIDLQESHSTVLEAACVSTPISLSR
ncbi:MAG: ATP-grasp domain-containing protein, partial [Gammaproteobacteria bacterium]|nr:ATP-grasp domain-containing protein [Gammaproteobacteria bacterium]